MVMTTLLIVGATGLVGGRAMELALADSRITRIIAPTRRALPPQDKVVNPRLDDLLAGAGGEEWQADGAICALGTTRAAAGSAAAFRAVDYELVLLVARRLREAGVGRCRPWAPARDPCFSTRGQRARWSRRSGRSLSRP
jgi:uncharacterized protein YbjT (DUF2867 family)